MLSIPAVLFLIALVFAIVECVKSHGQSLTVWAVILIAAGLLWGIL
jgi:hypothetical protein